MTRGAAAEPCDGAVPVRICVPDLRQVVAAMLAPVLRVAPRTMVSRVETARWTGLLPRTAALSWSGDLEPYRMSVVVGVARTVALDDLVEFECRLHHADVRPLTASRLKARALRVAQRLGCQEPAATAAPTRHVRVEPVDRPGMTRWTALVPADRSTLMWAAVQALGEEYLTARPDLTPSQADADAFADLVLGHAHVSTTVDLVVPAAASAGAAPCCGPPSSQSGDRAASAPTVADLPADTSSLDEERAYWARHTARVDANPHLQRDSAGRVWFVPGPVTVPSVGALLPEHVAAILADPDVLVRVASAHHDTGAVAALGSRVYRPGSRLARAVRLRDGTCRFPGCGTVAARCHLDHVVPFGAGLTAADNLQSLCATHHGFKHHAGWTVVMTPDGVCTWTAPTGRTHVTHPYAVYDAAA